VTNIGLYRLWGAGYPGLLIMMADPFSSAIRSLFPRHLGKDSVEIKSDVALVPEPEGPQGIWSVSVRCEGNTVGYLPAEIAEEWAGPVRRVVASGSLPVTASRIWGNMRDGWGGPTFFAHAHLSLQNPVEALPNNEPPLAPYTMLPPGPFVKVIKLEEHVADLLRLTPPGSRGLFIATLRERPPSDGRRAPVVEVCIDGKCVGELTLPMSQRYLPLVRLFQDRGLVTACYVDVAGSAIAPEVRIHAVKANEADDAFLRGGPLTLPPLVPRKDDPLAYDLAPMAEHLRPQPIPVAAEPIAEIAAEPISGQHRTFGDGATIGELTAMIRATAEVRGQRQFHTVRNLVLALAGELGDLAGHIKSTPDGAAGEAWIGSAAGSNIVALAINVFLLADVVGVDLTTEIRRKLPMLDGETGLGGGLDNDDFEAFRPSERRRVITSTFVLVPVAVADSAEPLKFLAGSDPQNSDDDTPAELDVMIADLSAQHGAAITIARPADASGAVITVDCSQTEALIALFEATKKYSVAAYDTGLKRLYNPRGSTAVQLILGGEVLVPYATMQLLADVTRNPAWPNPASPFVILGRDDDPEDNYYIQSYREIDGSYVLEYRDGSEERHFGVETFDRRLVLEALWAWVVDDHQHLQTIAPWQRVEFDSEGS
jgi:hypothetical protein